jgi:hypothetical protein
MRSLAWPIATALIFFGRTAPSVLAAQAPPRGSIEGDVYLLTRGGDTKKGAGLTVHLLRFADARQIDKTAVPCAAYQADAKEFRDQQLSLGSDASSPEAQRYLRQRREMAVSQVREVLISRTVAEAGSGMNAHYRFSGLRAGVYALWAEMSLGTNDYAWFVPLALKAGQARALDLDNAVESSESLYCGAPMATE